MKTENNNSDHLASGKPEADTRALTVTDKAIEKARAIMSDLVHADLRGVAPPQNWTTRAANAIRELHEIMIDDRFDLDYHKAILDGSWPQAEEILTRALDRVKAKRESGISTK